MQYMEKNKIVFITGGSRGIGAAIALRLAKSGYDIWLNYRNSDSAALEIQKMVECQGVKCTLLKFDISLEEEVDAALIPLLANDTPYALVHNAGFTKDTLLAMMQRKEWDAVINVHLTGFFLVARLLVKAMITAKQGRVVAISSVSGETGQAGQVNYSAAKAGLNGAIKALAKEVARRNILVNAVAPGFIETDMISHLPKEKIVLNVPLQRLGKPEEVAGVVNFLLGPDATYITGQVIGVNGGLYI